MSDLINLVEEDGRNIAEINVAPHQAQVINDPTRFKVVRTARQIGKTSGAVIDDFLYAVNNGPANIGVCGPSTVALKRGYWRIAMQFYNSDIGDLHGITVNKSEMAFYFRNGSKIALLSLEGDGSRVRGDTFDKLTIDETQDVSVDAWNLSLRPAAAKNLAPVTFYGTPKPTSELFRTLDSFAQDDSKENWKGFTITTEEAGFVPVEEILDAKETLSTKHFQQEYLGMFVDVGNQVYKYDPAIHANYELEDRGGNLYVGCDFNVKVMSWSISQMHDGVVETFDEITKHDTSVEEMCVALLDNYPLHRLVCYADPAGKARNAARKDRMFDIMREFGLTVKAKDAHMEHLPSVEICNMMFKNAAGKVRVQVNPDKCPMLIKDFEFVEWKENQKNICDKDKNLTHASDGWRYKMEHLGRIKKQASGIIRVRGL